MIEQHISIDEIKSVLGDRNLLEVSKRAGVSYSSIRKIMNGDGDKISVRTSIRLSNYLSGKNHGEVK